MTESEIKKRIDKYIDGELSDKETEQLWIVFLKNPEWFEYYQEREKLLG